MRPYPHGSLVSGACIAGLMHVAAWAATEAEVYDTLRGVRLGSRGSMDASLSLETPHSSMTPQLVIP